MSRTKNCGERRGAVIVLVAVTMMLLLTMVAFAVDIGCVLKIKTDMQRTADAAALAAAQKLAQDPSGAQDVQAARAAVAEYVQQNMETVGESSFAVADVDIEIGTFDSNSIYSGNATIAGSTPNGNNIVRVTLRRDGVVNPRTPLIFGQVLGFEDTALAVTAVAVLPAPDKIFPGTAVLPFAFDFDEFNGLSNGDSFVIYGDGKMTDGNGNELPGNWGTLDIGNSSNSTSDQSGQIENGLRESDLTALHGEGRIPQSSHIDANVPVELNGDPGLSSGMKHAVISGEGKQYLIPLFDSVNGGGGNGSSYNIVGWAAVTLEDSRWGGAKKTWVKVTKSTIYDGHLGASSGSLSGGDSGTTIIGATGAPFLIR